MGISSQNDLIEEAAREREGQRKELSALAYHASLVDSHPLLDSRRYQPH